MVTRSARRQTPAGRHLAAFFALVCAGCAGNGAGPRDAHDAEATAGAGAASPPLPHDGRATRRTLGWVSLAVGAEAAIVAIVTSGMLVHEKSILDAQCDAQKLCSPAGLDAAGSISSLTPWNTGTWVAAALGVGAGAALLLTGRPDAPGSTAITWTPDGAGPGVGVRSRF
jgi:hypothetical protein